MFGFRKQPIVGLGLSTGGVALKELANVYELQLGNVKFNKVQFIIYPGTASLEMYNGLPIVGSLSMDMLENVDFELDLAHKKLNLFSQEHCAGKVVYWTNEYASAPIFKSRIGTLYFPMELDGKKVEATFHTADQNSSLSTEITKKVYDFDEKSEDTEKVTAPNGSATYFYRAMTISAPGLAINNARLRLDTSSSKGCVPSKRISDTKAAGYTGCMGIYPLTLGRDTLSKLRIYVATKEKMIYYSSANATKEPAAAAK
jgi:hypothetical protein